MLINIKKTMTILSTLLLGIMCSFCSDTIDVYAGQYGERKKVRMNRKLRKL